MGRNSLTLNDDNIDSIIYDIHEYILRTPLLVDPQYEDEGYDHFHEFVWGILEPYSNGHRNYN